MLKPYTRANMTDPSTPIAEPISSDEVDDNWSGLTDPAERRRRQNRINQRAYRKLHAPVDLHRTDANLDLKGKRKRLQNKETHPKTLVKSTKSAPSTSSTSPQSDDSVTPDGSKVKSCCSPGVLQDLLEKFAKSAIESYARGDPAADHLMTLTKVNVFRAFAQNLELIGWSPYWMDDDAISLFNQALPQREFTPDDHSHIPPTLRPTRVQKKRRTTPGWISSLSPKCATISSKQAMNGMMCSFAMTSWDSGASRRWTPGYWCGGSLGIFAIGR
ncbi:hypothetical protein N7508_000921 [Penicillium antarcticum]|uniref:uncharacterized protein n=1 Tax=Penicillium antarcticum TaxID=416450 RepID=UPI00238C8F0D|nr:uncharacterized protein N7508_000921 [Penicillium antarcticum]KAJ5320638.1 hypothetical protein N7508_000921 [Penicillium antarcticum]